MPPSATPLPLESTRWRELKAHFGNAGQDTELPSVPTLLRRWHEAVGTYGEEYEYGDLRESFLHQGTILDVAYAVVPHLASRLSELDPDRRSEVLEDIAVVEAVRLLPRERVEAQIAEVQAAFPEDMRELMARNTRERLASLPSDLASAYLAAIERAETLGGPRWRVTALEGEELQPRRWRRHVRFLREAGWSDADIAFGLRVLRRGDDDFLRCRVIDKGVDIAREAACEVENAPVGWFERTRLRTVQGDLGFLALHTLAWWAELDLDALLAV
jgi:DNA-directed RNA polymerase subunit F